MKLRLLVVLFFSPTTVNAIALDPHVEVVFRTVEAAKALSPVENGGAGRRKIWMKMAAHMRAVR